MRGSNRTNLNKDSKTETRKVWGGELKTSWLMKRDSRNTNRTFHKKHDRNKKTFFVELKCFIRQQIKIRKYFKNTINKDIWIMRKNFTNM